MRYKEISLCACCIEFRDEGNLNKTYFGVTGSSVVVLPLIGRWNKGRYKRGKRDGNLNKKHILYFGVLWSFLGSSLVLRWSLTLWELGRYKGKRILIFVLSAQKKRIVECAFFLRMNYE